MPTRTLSGAALAAIGLLICLWPESSQAGGVVRDISFTSLKSAITQGGTVYFATTGTVQVASTVVVSKDVQLIDTNRSVVVSGVAGGRGPLFRVDAGVRFEVVGLALANGSGTNGGAVYNAGMIVVRDCTFSNNTTIGTSGAQGSSGEIGTVLGSAGGAGKQGLSAAGGAIYNVGTSVIGSCTFLTNRAIGGTGGTGGTGGNSGYQGGNGGSGGTGATATGGAIYSTGLLQVSNSYFAFNSAHGGGGGLGGTNGTAPIRGESGDGGAGNSALGGAIFLQSGTFLSCTFHRNSALAGDSANAAADTSHFVGVAGKRGPDSYGGGLYAEGTLTLVNCTFSTNTAAAGKAGRGGNATPAPGNGGDGGDAWGGSVYCGSGGALYLTNCTLAAGAALPGAAGAAGAGGSGQPGAAGRVRGDNVASAGVFVMKNTILAYSTNLANIYGGVLDELGNMSSDNTPPGLPSFRRNLDPLLAPLSNNGGPTPTMGIGLASPAVNWGDDTGILPCDQRGYPRDGICDIGAFEIQISAIPTLNLSSSSNQLVLSWPASASHYVVWSANDLTNPSWRHLTNSAEADATFFRVTLPGRMTNRVQFFRLQQLAP